jgi:hypothetical protein
LSAALQAQADGEMRSADAAPSIRDLAVLESGKVRIGEWRGSEPWRDMTQALIVHHKRIMATYDGN